MLTSSIFALLASAAAVSSHPHSHFRHRRAAPIPTVVEHCIQAKSVALTFDDGPFDFNKQIVDMLVSNNAKGTFFMNGNNYGCIYDAANVARVKYAHEKGMMIASHTWGHPDLVLDNLNNNQLHDQLYRMEEAFSRIIGVKPGFMRPPFGSFNENFRQISVSRNQTVAIWDLDTGDANNESVDHSKSVYTNAANANVNNMNVLNHETIPTTTSQVLPYAINLLKSKGYNLVTLAECLGVQPYAAVGLPQTGSWSCSGAPAPGVGCGGSIPCQTGVPILNSGTPTEPPPSGPTTTGLVIRPGSSSTKCLTPASNTEGAAVAIQDCNGSANQAWTKAGNVYQIFTNKCLTVPGGSTANGVKLQITTCGAGNANQQFTTSGNTITWTGHNQCLDLTDGSLTNGNVVQLWQCFAGNANQVWNVVAQGPVTPPPPPPTTAKTIRPGKSNSKCLTPVSNTSGAAVQIQSCSTGSASQAWTSVGATLQIFSNKCLTVPGGSTADGVKLQITTCATGNANQQFTRTGSTIVWSGRNKCMDLTDGSTTNGNPIQLWQCFAGNTNQVWNFV